MPNPAIVNDAFCVLAMRSETEGFYGGFDIIGPFDTEKRAATWGDKNITRTAFDNPHWVVAPMASRR